MPFDERYVCQVCDNVGHQASCSFVFCELLNKTYKGEHGGSKGACTTHVSSNESPDNSWLLDTGGGHHLAVDASNVPQSIPYQESDGVSR